MKIPRAFEPLFIDPHVHNKIRGGRGGAKTRTIVSLCVEVMKQAPLCVICGREIQKSLKESSFLAFKNEIYRAGYGQYFNIVESQGVIESTAGGRAVFIGLQQHTVDSIKSYEGFHWGWIEEAQSVSKRSLETLIPTLRQDGWFRVEIGGQEFRFPLRMFIYTYNPYSWDDPIDIALPDSRDDVQVLTVNWRDNPWFPETLNAERKEAKETMSRDEYLRIWEGIPYESAENAVMSRADIDEAMSRQASTDGGIVVGADIARFGDDRTVFIKRQGLQVVGVKVLEKKDTQESASVLFDFAQGGKIIIDDTGVGGGVTDRLRRLGANVIPINFGGKAQNKNKYPDIISEMWFCLADQIKNIGIPRDLELMAELAGRYYKYTNDERRKVESKEEYKKRTGRRSPDCFIAGTMIKTPRGDIAIENLSVGDYVFTPFGQEKIIKTWRVKTDVLFRAGFDDGTELIGKPGHRVYANNRFYRIDKLYGHMVECFSWKKILAWQILRLFYTKAQSITFKHLVDITTQENPFSESDCFIGEYGLKTMEKYQKVSLFTMLTGIGWTMIYPIFNLLKRGNTQANTGTIQKKALLARALPVLKKQGLARLFGINQKKATSGTLGTVKTHINIENEIGLCAPIVAKNMKRTINKIHVAQNAGIKDIWKTVNLSKRLVLCVAKLSESKLFTREKRCVAVDLVEQNYGGNVYNLTLENHNVYYANGVLVENCADALILAFYNRDNMAAAPTVALRL